MRKILKRTTITKVSSKGQVVIPEAARKDLRLKEGDIMAVTVLPEKDMVVLKRVHEPAFERELPTLKAIAEAWNEIEKGRYEKLPTKEFLKKLRRW